MLRLNWRDWLRYSLIGAGVGAVVLGIGGRLAMRGIAVLSGAPPSFTFGGSLRVVLMGALSGLGGAWILKVLRFFLARRWLIQTLLFYAIIVLIMLRGLKPVDSQRLVLFLPVVLLYAFLVRVLTRRRRTLPAETTVQELSPV
ncbi:MAG TPA: hypothetical protein VEK83_09645 [Gemmatimonadales bacterium]|nr:hypothetical protein [Gemmatimonadales bacterium]